MAWERTGTVAVTSGNNIVTGTNTKFATNCRLGDGFIGPDGRNYEVTQIASELQLTIRPAYLGATAASATFSIIPVQGYDKKLADEAYEILQTISTIEAELDDGVKGAKDSATAAAASRDAAATSSTQAGSAALAAAGYSDSAITARNAAQQAVVDATTLKNAAGQSATDANSAKTAAQQAVTDATAAKTAAKSSQDAAKASQDAAAASASTASDPIRNGALTGLVTSNKSVVVPADTTLVALGKLQAQVTAVDPGSTISRYTYNVAAGQTVISGNDLNNKPLAYTAGNVMLVTMNGVDLWLTNDYTATTGNSITLVTAAEAACEVAITTFGSFAVANTYTKAESAALITSLALKSASKADIVGTLVNNAGVVSNAIIETGTNANGTYTKWADGTMICTKTVTLTTQINILVGGQGSVFGSSIGTGNQTMPATFASVPKVSAWVSTNAAFTGWIGGQVAIASTSVWPSSLLLEAFARPSQTYNIDLVAVGRWF